MARTSIAELKRNIDKLVKEKYALRSALQNLHDGCAEYVKINNLYDKHGRPAIWNQDMCEARKALKETEFAVMTANDH